MNQTMLLHARHDPKLDHFPFVCYAYTDVASQQTAPSLLMLSLSILLLAFCFISTNDCRGVRRAVQNGSSTGRGWNEGYAALVYHGACPAGLGFYAKGESKAAGESKGRADRRVDAAGGEGVSWRANNQMNGRWANAGWDFRLEA